MYVLLLASLLSISFVAAGHAANWGKFQRDHCVRDGERQYSAILWNIPWGKSWEDACKQTKANIAGHRGLSAARCISNTFHMWGEFNVPDESCAYPLERLADELAANPKIPFSSACVLAISKKHTSDGCSTPLTDGTTKVYKDEFRDACIIHDVCYTLPWYGITSLTDAAAQERCDETFHNQMLEICNGDVFCNTVANTWITFGKFEFANAFKNNQTLSRGDNWANKDVCAVTD